MQKREVSSPTAVSFKKQYSKSVLWLCIAAICLTIVFNVFISLLPIQWIHFDTTDIKLYSLSDFTEQILSGVEEDIHLYFVAQYGKEDGIIKELLQRYEDLSTNIYVEQIDPVLQPDFLEQYAGSIETNSVIVTANGCAKIVSPSSMYVEYQQYTQEGGYAYEAQFVGEQEITGAISFVISDELPKLYLLTGHGEEKLPDYIQQAITRENMEIETINLCTQESVPADADMLLLYAPTRDLLEQEAKMILTYLQNGGRMLLIGGCQPAPYLDLVMANYGIERLEGNVIERNGNYYLEYPTYILANIAAHSITRPLANQGYSVLSPVSQGLVPREDTRETIVSTPLLYTTDSALSISESGEGAEAEALGPFTLGLAVEEKISENATRLVWFTSPYLLLEDVNELSSGANYDLFFNSLNWLYGYEQGISVRAKNLLMDYLSIRQSQEIILGTGMIIGIPAIVLMAGGVRLYKRRSKITR